MPGSCVRISSSLSCELPVATSIRTLSRLANTRFKEALA
jgi:hypothetical protein